MTDFTWFRLALRAIGVLLIGLAIPNTMHYLVSIVHLVAGAPSMDIGPFVFSAVAGLAGVVLELGFGLYLLVGGAALFRYCTRDLTGLCPSCGYDLKNIAADRCPECGTPVAKHHRPEAPAIAAQP